MINTGTLSDRVYVALRERILSGEFLPGTRLNLTHLANDLDVSNTPLREAIARLERVGLVEVIPYSGPRVRALTAEQVSDVFAVRIELEALAVRLTATRADEAALSRLQAAIEMQEAAYAAGDRAGFNAADRCFHEILVEVSGNSVLLEMLPLLSDRMALLIESYDLQHRLNTHGIAQHRELLTALQARDVEAAEDSLRRQLASGRWALLDYMGHHTQGAVGDGAGGR
ncbi:MAG: GntR family transcriptional regulator [Anaerolineae bacterium]|nr:GntR family transcriptional regulator [Anaerolineae bacterium]